MPNRALLAAIVAVELALSVAAPAASSHRVAPSRQETVALASPMGLDSRVAQTGQKRPDAPHLAPYVPTPQEVVDRMLRLAAVGKGDVVYDLGCGDGRIPITAARRFGARGVGVDIDPQRIAEAEANAKREGVSHLVSFRLQDALATDVSDATVVTLYLLSASNLKLRPILTKQLKPGARIVSHAFSMGDWQADKVDTFQDTSGTTRTLYLWKTDGKIRP
jgi:SAM-dependent methyltransferase